VQARTGDMAASRRNLALVKKIAEDNSGNFFRSLVYTEIAAVQAKTGDVVRANNTADHISVFACSILAYMKIVEVQVQAGDITGAMDTLDWVVHDDDESDVYIKISKLRVKTADFAGTTVNLSEVKRWTHLALAYQTYPSLSNLQKFLMSLKGNNFREVAFTLTSEGIECMVDALEELQNNEIKWSELRAQ